MSADPASARARLSLATLAHLPAHVRRPSFEPTQLKPGIVHLGVGAFQRAHQAVYTEDAMAATPGDWGVIGVSLRRPDAAQKLGPQNCLYSVEMRGETSSHRVIGVLRDVLTAPEAPGAVEAVLASPTTHIVTLTVTEKGYALGADGALDTSNTEIARDLRGEGAPCSTLGWLIRGLRARYRSHRTPLTIMSCDNLADNGHKLRAALLQFGRELDADAAAWISDAVSFPNTMVDCVVPATDAAALARARAALGVEDAAVVQREEFSQWVIEDAFAGPRPAWEAAGAEIVRDVAPFERIKLHILNATHSALAYLGPPRGHVYVRQAIADPELLAFLDDMVRNEIAPALAPLQVHDYWQAIKRRYANPNIDHALAQIAEDGSKKLSVRILPLLIENARAGRQTQRMAAVVRAWLESARKPVKDPQSERLARWAEAGGDLAAALDDAALFTAPFRTDPSVRGAMMVTS